MATAEQHYAAFLEALGLDLKKYQMEDTPRRVAKLYKRLFAGLEEAPKDLLGDLMVVEDSGLVAIKNIPYFSTCEHHLTPFYGQVNIVYQPGKGKVAGLSKFKEVVHYFAARPQLQERLVEDIGDYLEEVLQPEGLLITLEAIQLCMMTKDGLPSPALSMESRGRLAPGEDLHQAGLLLLGDK